MPKGWAALPRGVRWPVAGVAILVLVLAVSWVLFVPAADWLAHHDVGSATGSLHETALDNARGRLVTLGAGLFAAGALVFTARNFTVSRRTLELTEQGQVTDRYTKAIKQLGSGQLDVRVGGIYALERIARDSARDHPTVMVVLSVFILEHSHEQWPLPEHANGSPPAHKTRPDVQAAIGVIGHRDPGHDIHVIDLTAANLRYANLDAMNFTSSQSRQINWAKKNEKAWLGGIDLSDATLKWANLTGAFLQGANLARAQLQGTILRDANLTEADLRYADLRHADLTGAILIGTKLTGAMAGDVKWPGNGSVPAGWKLDADSGRLVQTSQKS